MISPERTKEIFLALKLHFTGSYDYVKYAGKIKAPVKPPEQWALGRIAKKYKDEEKVRDFFIANMTYDYITNGKINGFVNSYNSAGAVDTYDAWQAWWTAFSYKLKSDMAQFESVKNAIEIVDGEHPKVFTMFLEAKVNFNTLACLMMSIKGLSTYWEKCDDSILFGGYLKLLKKYVPLLDQDKEKINVIIRG